MKYITFTAITMLALAGCTNPNPGEPLSPDFGNAVHANIAAQVDNPMPNEKIGVGILDGQRFENAIDRYRTNKVYKPHLPLQGGNVYDQSQSQQQ
jgi:hypothetical protein